MPVTVPPLLAVNDTPTSTDELSPESTMLGVPEKSKIVSSGVTALDAEEAGLVPTELVAVTWKVYAVPSLRPVTVADVAEPLLTCTGVPAVVPAYGVIV
jgi:hypothetical protein